MLYMHVNGGDITRNIIQIKVLCKIINQMGVWCGMNDKNHIIKHCLPLSLSLGTISK